MLSDLAELFRQAVLSGPMLAAIPVAVVAGAVSFASPCVLPLVPGYLGYLGGMSGTLGEAGSRAGRGSAAVRVTAGSAAATAGAAPARSTAAAGPSREASTDTGAPRIAATGRGARRRPAGTGRLLAGVLLFVAGFSAVFLLLGVVFGWLGLALTPWLDTITRALGVVVILLGLAFMGSIPFLQRDRRLRLNPRAGLWGAPVLGVVFGLGWAPCIGPTLSAVLLLSLDGSSAVRGGVLALAYCVGLGLPFILIALAYARSTRAVAALRRHRLLIMRVGGGLLVLVGLALVTGLWGTFTGWVQGLVANFVTVV